MHMLASFSGACIYLCYVASFPGFPVLKRSLRMRLGVCCVHVCTFSVSPAVSLCLLASISAFSTLNFFSSASISFSVTCKCVCMYTHVCTYMFVYMCVYKCMCMWVCVSLQMYGKKKRFENTGLSHRWYSTAKGYLRRFDGSGDIHGSLPCTIISGCS